MNSKFLKILLTVLLLNCVLSQAKAALIIGELYTDTLTPGLQWEYIGRFDLSAGPQYNDANEDGTSGDFALALNGLQAASMLFSLDMSEIAIGAYDDSGQTETAATPGSAIVNHQAWYDTFWDNDPNRPVLSTDGEAIPASVDGDTSLYDAKNDRSAYVSDRFWVEGIYNYVFKSVKVPEPSTLPLFSLALLGLFLSRSRKA